MPEVGRGIGKAISEFRKGAQEMTESFKEEVAKPGEAPNAPAASEAAAVGPQAGRFCSKCGAPNTADARFCNRCGAELPA